MRRILILLCFLLLALVPVTAQDGLNLPTELYILLNEGRVERYGLGVAGVERVTPDDEFVVDFRVAPDGNWLAYRTQAGLFLRNIYENVPVQALEAERASLPLIRGQGETMAWSPHSRNLAYTTEYGARVYFFETAQFADITTPNLLHLLWSRDGSYLAAEATEKVWWFFKRENNVMTPVAALPGANSLTWLDDNRLVFAPIEGGLALLDLANRNQQTLLLAATDSYHLPYRLPDGRIRVYIGAVTAANLMEINLTGGVSTEIIGTGAVDLTNVRWSPTANLLVAFQGGALAIIDPVSGQGFTLPIMTSSAYSWGPEYPPPAIGLQLPQDAYFIALSASGVEQVWRLPADGSAALPLTNSETPVSEYRLAPDKQQLAYVSDAQLWLQRLDSADAPSSLTEVNPLLKAYPAWSPDGQSLYFTDNNLIRRIDISTGTVHDFLTPTGDFAYQRVFPANGISAVLVSLLYADASSGLAVFDMNTAEKLGEYRISENNANPRWLETTEFLFDGTLAGGTSSEMLTGLYQVDVNSSAATPLNLFPVFGNLRILNYRSINASTIRIVLQRPSPNEILISDLSRAEGRPNLLGSGGYMQSPQISPDGSMIAGYTHANGALIFYDVVNQRAYLLDTFPQVQAFQWG